MAKVLWGSARADSGAPIAPTEYVPPAYSLPVGTVHTPADSAALIALLADSGPGNTLLAGDVIQLDKAVTYSGNFYFPDLTTDSWTYVVSSGVASLPASGTRVTSADTANLVAVNPLAGGGGNSPRAAINVGQGANKWRFVGIKSIPVDEGSGISASRSFALCSYTNGSGSYTDGTAPTTDAHLATGIIFDRCWARGHDTSSTTKVSDCIRFDVAGGAIIDSTIELISSSSGDGGKAIWVYKGGHEITVENNYISASGVGMMVGGTDGFQIPADIVYRGNHSFKKTQWQPGHGDYDSYARVAKNHFELKNAKRVLIENNVAHRQWRGSQEAGFVFTVRNQNGGNNDATVSDVLCQYNHMKEILKPFQLSTNDDLQTSDVSKRITIKNNLIEGAGYAATSLGGYHIHFTRSSATAEYWRVIHNTFIDGAYSGWVDHNGGVNFEDGPAGAGAFVNDLVFIDNIIEVHESGGTSNCVVTNGGYGEGTATLNERATTYQFEKNVMFDSINGKTYPANNYISASITEASVTFEDYAGSDYRLASGSPYLTDATDGTAIGCDITTLNTRISGVV